VADRHTESCILHSLGLAGLTGARREACYALSIAVAAVLTAFSAQTASAQLPALTNADVGRLGALHVSDQTVIAVIHEATATQFDLSSQAVSDLAVAGVSTVVIATMRQSSTPSANELAGPPQQSPGAGPQTLAGASVQATAASPGRRPQLSIVGPSSPPALNGSTVMLVTCRSHPACRERRCDSRKRDSGVGPRQDGWLERSGAGSGLGADGHLDRWRSLCRRLTTAPFPAGQRL